MTDTPSERVALVGLGYVGLPLAAAMARKYDVVGFDINPERVSALQSGYDRITAVSTEDLRNPRLELTGDPERLGSCTCIIVAVPTPITSSKEPDLTALKKSSVLVGNVLKPGMMVVYESTVYPGVTEDVCLPILEKESGLKLGDFDLAYSPERVNPGDHEHAVETTVKVVSGHDEKARKRVTALYGAVITAGLFEAADIKTAEAAKVIENVQRDLNIALMNELSKVFSLIGIHTKDVLDAAATKWNFHRYAPGLVGGHCIGVDPYYLTHRALELSYHPEVILAGRRINDNMGNYVGDLTVRALNAEGALPGEAHVCVWGLTYKENVVDFRNTRAIDVVRFIQGHGARVSVWEPMVSEEELQERFDVETITYEAMRDVDAVVLINAHDAFKTVALAELKTRMRTPVLVDLKNFFSPEEAGELGFRYLTL